MRSLITILAFAGKEIRQVLRQPKLMTALILGPFIILALFAAGFQADPPPLRTLLVIPEGSPLQTQVPDLQEAVGGDIDVVGTSPDEEAARTQLLAGEVDIVVVVPPNPAETIRGDDHATVTVLHNRLDPFDRAYITVSAQASVDELNRTLLAQVVAAAQDEAGNYGEALPSARRSMEELAIALRSGDEEAAADAQTEAVESLGIVEDAVGLSAGLFQGVGGGSAGESESLSDRLSSSRQAVDEIEPTDPDAASEAVAVEAELAELETTLAQFRAVSPEVLVQPFVAETSVVEGASIPVATYYSPAVIVVLLQHVVLTFAALSVVNERSLGATEMFRVGPVRPIEFLAGKYIGYASLGILVAALLVAAVVFVFGTPMLGSWAWLTLVLVLTILASLGLGFVIAAAANSDAQAVQFAMLALLFTIFFGGLVVSLSRLSEGVRQIAYLAPATSATAAAHDVMFRGDAPSPLWLAILIGYTVVSFGLAYWWLRRRQVA